MVKNTNVMHVVCSTDDNYAKYCAVMLCSLFENNKDSVLDIHILIDALTEENKQILSFLAQRYRQKIYFYKVNVESLSGVQFREKSPLSCAAYYRILLASTLPKTINKVLYLDCDLLVLKSIKELFELDLSNYALAAVEDQEGIPINEEHRFQLNLSYTQSYFCSGVMLINLNYWRENAVEQKLIEFSRRKRHVYFHDQDALNFLFSGKWFKLAPQWNRFNLVLYNKNSFQTKEDEFNFIFAPAIVHFASRAKPWLKIKFLNYAKKYDFYFQKSFGSNVDKKTFNGKMIVYKKIIEVNLLNVLYHLSPIFSVPIIANLNFLKILASLIIRKNIRKIKLFRNRNF